MITCSECGEIKKETAFNKDPKGPNGRRRKCRDCTQHKDRNYLYGIDQTTFEAMQAAQTNLCAVCEAPFGPDNLPHVDHNHSCCPGRRSCGRCVRGLLCGRCNSVLGYSEDDPDLLELAAEYLRRSYDQIYG